MVLARSWSCPDGVLVGWFWWRPGKRVLAVSLWGPGEIPLGSWYDPDGVVEQSFSDAGSFPVGSWQGPGKGSGGPGGVEAKLGWGPGKSPGSVLMWW